MQASHTPLALLFALTLAPASAQVRQDWESIASIPPLADDVFGGALRDSAGRWIVATESVTAPGNARVVLDAYLPDGSLSWTMRFGLGGPTTPADLALHPGTGDLVVCGNGRLVAAGPLLPFVARFNASGSLIWSQTYVPAAGTAQIQRVVVDASGDIYALGSQQAPGIILDLLVLKLAASGPLQWARTIGVSPTSSESARGIALHPGGGVVVSGQSIQSLNPTLCVTSLLDAGGNVAWTRLAFGTPGGAQDIACDATGASYVCGKFNDSGLVFCYDALGHLSWSQTVSSSPSSIGGFAALAIDPIGDVVAAGATVSLGGFNEGLVAKLAPNGVERWARSVPGPGQGHHFFSTLAIDSAGEIACGGSNVSSKRRAFVARLDRDGTSAWTVLHESPDARDESVARLAFDGSGGVLFAAQRGTPAFGDDDLVSVRLAEQGVAFCLGDGSATACPCGNASASFARAGCLNSTGAAGRLDDEGSASLASDTLDLVASGLPTAAAATFVQGDQRENGGAGVVFGDGLRCVAGGLTRLATIVASGGSASLASGGIPISVLGQVASPGTWTYQAIYRNAASFCTPSVFNGTNGIEMTWSL